MISIFLGIFSVVIGIFGLIWGWDQFIAFLIGFLPISFIVAGMIAITAGFSGVKALKKEEKNKHE